MAQLFSNNALSALDGGVTAVATVINLTATEGALFNAPTGGDFELITVYDGADIASSTNVEIMKVTARSTDQMTVVRGQEGTSGFAFSSGAGVEGCATAGTFDALKEGRAGLFQDVTEKVFDGTGTAVNTSDGNAQNHALAANQTPTFGIVKGQSVAVRVAIGAFTWTLSNVDNWVGGAPPSIGAVHDFVFYNIDGTNVTGLSVGVVS